MTEATETVLQYLARVRRKDAEKGEHVVAGWRSTREVCEFFDRKPSSMLNELNRLVDAGDVACASEGSGYIWRAIMDGGPPLLTDPPSLPDAVRAYLAALDAMDGSATNAITYTNQRDTLAECLDNLRTAVAQVIP